MGTVVFHPRWLPCQLCGLAVGDRYFESLVVCEGCWYALANPSTVEAPREKFPSLTDVVDKLLRDVP